MCSSDLESRAILIETLVELDRRLDTLPAPVVKAFLLSQLDGMKQADIAAELKLSLATVQRHIAKAFLFANCGHLFAGAQHVDFAFHDHVQVVARIALGTAGPRDLFALPTARLHA